METRISRSLEEAQGVARDWLAAAAARPADPLAPRGALVVGLSGHLGAGKTAFVKAVARELGVAEEVTSPTFVIMKSYETAHPRWRRLIHIDAYRLEGAEQLEALRFEGFAADPGALVMVEWPENVGIPPSIWFEAEGDAHKVQYQA